MTISISNLLKDLNIVNLTYSITPCGSPCIDIHGDPARALGVANLCLSVVNIDKKSPVIERVFEIKEFTSSVDLEKQALAIIHGYHVLNAYINMMQLSDIQNNTCVYCKYFRLKLQNLLPLNKKDIDNIFSNTRKIEGGCYYLAPYEGQTLYRPTVEVNTPTCGRFDSVNDITFYRTLCDRLAEENLKEDLGDDIHG